MFDPLAHLRRWWRRRSTEARLRQLSPRLLGDIGADRETLSRFVSEKTR